MNAALATEVAAVNRKPLAAGAEAQVFSSHLIGTIKIVLFQNRDVFSSL